MLPKTLPLTELKRDYKFLWSIDGASGNAITGSKLTIDKSSLSTLKDAGTSTSLELSLMKTFTLDNPVYCGYVSQFAEEVKLPDDEFEIEQMPNGPVTYEMPKKVKLANIQVTYLEDTINSVYNFHKTWFNMIRGGTGVYFNPPAKLCATARYIEFDDTLTSAEYALYHGAWRDYLNNAATSGLSASAIQSLTSFISSIKPEIPQGAKPTGMTMYPRIYPTRISRSSANKGGSGLHKVTVTYSRIPVFQKNHTNLQKLAIDGITWNDYTGGIF